MLSYSKRAVEKNQHPMADYLQSVQAGVIESKKTVTQNCSLNLEGFQPTTMIWSIYSMYLYYMWPTYQLWEVSYTYWSL
jgi:hypothetical protein